MRMAVEFADVISAASCFQDRCEYFPVRFDENLRRYTSCCACKPGFVIPDKPARRNRDLRISIESTAEPVFSTLLKTTSDGSHAAASIGLNGSEANFVEDRAHDHARRPAEGARSASSFIAGNRRLFAYVSLTRHAAW